jgi:hypothetical protein
MMNCGKESNHPCIIDIVKNENWGRLNSADNLVETIDRERR